MGEKPIRTATEEALYLIYHIQQLNNQRLKNHNHATIVLPAVDSKHVDDLMGRLERFISEFLQFELQHPITNDNKGDYIPNHHRNVSLIRILDNHPKILQLVSTIMRLSYAISFPRSVLRNCVQIILYMFILASKKASIPTDQPLGSVTSQAFLHGNLQSSVLQFCLYELQAMDNLPLLATVGKKTERSISVDETFSYQNQFMNMKYDSNQFANSCAEMISNYSSSKLEEHREIFANLLHIYLVQTKFSLVPPKLMQSLMLPYKEEKLRLFDVLLSSEDQILFCCAQENFYLQELQSLLVDFLQHPLSHLVDDRDCGQLIANKISNSRLEMICGCLTQDSTRWYTLTAQLQRAYKSMRNENIIRLYSLMARKVMKLCLQKNPSCLDQFCAHPSLFRKLLEQDQRCSSLYQITTQIWDAIQKCGSLRDREQLWFHLQSLPWLEISSIEIAIKEVEDRMQSSISHEIDDMHTSKVEYINLLRVVCFMNLKPWDAEEFRKYVSSCSNMDQMVASYHQLPEIYARFKTRPHKQLVPFTNKVLSFLYDPKKNTEHLSLLMILKFVLVWTVMNMPSSSIVQYYQLLQQLKPTSIIPKQNASGSTNSKLVATESIQDDTIRSQLCELIIDEMQKLIAFRWQDPELLKQLVFISYKMQLLSITSSTREGRQHNNNDESSVGATHQTQLPDEMLAPYLTHHSLTLDSFRT